MKELKFEEPEKLKVSVKGNEYVMTYPEWGMIEELESKGDDLQSADVKKFLTDCGLPQDGLKHFQMKQLIEIYQELIGLKKN